MDRRPEQGVALERLEEVAHVVLHGEREAHALDRDPELGLAGRGKLIRRAIAGHRNRMFDRDRVDGLDPDVDVAPAGAPPACPDRTAADVKQTLD